MKGRDMKAVIISFHRPENATLRLTLWVILLLDICRHAGSVEAMHGQVKGR